MATKATTYVGNVNCIDAHIAVVFEKNTAIAVVSDGDRVGFWLTGAVDVNDLVLAARTGESVEAMLEDGTVTGLVRLGDRSSHRFVANRATGRSGLSIQRITHEGTSYDVARITQADGSTQALATFSARGRPPWDFGVPVPPHVAGALTKGPSPRRKSEQVPIDAETLCYASTTYYHHVYKVWNDLGRPSGPLRDDVIKAFNDMIRKCAAAI